MLGLGALALSLVGAMAQPPSIRDQFDCNMRSFAMEFAQALQPFRAPQVFSDIADALNGTPEKAPSCNVSFPLPPGRAPSRFPFLASAPRAPGAGGATFYVATTGSDGNPGTLAAPFASIAAALAATRATPGPDSIILRGGTYYSQPTTVLLPQDSGLSISNFPAEEVWLSGGAPLPAAAVWKAYNVNATPAPPSPTPTWHVAMDQNDVTAGAGGAYVANKTATWQECQALCQGGSSGGRPCAAWTWHDEQQGGYALDCYFRPDGVWAPVPQAGHVSGYFGADPAPAQANVWSMDLSAFGIAAIKGLRAADGTRLTRARFPNGFPETKGFMPPAVFRATSWTPQQLPRAPATQVDLPRSVIDRNTSISSFQTFTAGVGGTCSRFQPDSGYWCSKAVQGGGSVIYSVPTAMQATQAVLPHTPYANPVGGIVQTWRPGHWASWMYEIGSADFDAATNATNFTFAWGGFQGSRGADTGEDTYIENIFEELDAPSEWFFNESSSMLYLWYNASGGTPPPSDGSLVLLTGANKHLFNITGTQANPVKGITLSGLGFRDTGASLCLCLC